ncbi:MAG: transglutaminase domain-containing protein [Promethearchaeota archaeon]
MHIHSSYGIQFEKDPPFKLKVWVTDLDNFGLYAKVTISTGSEKFVETAPVVVFRSPFKYDLSEISITVEFNTQVKRIKPASHDVHVVFNVPKYKSPPPKRKPPQEPKKPVKRKRTIYQPVEHKRTIERKKEVDDEGTESFKAIDTPDIVELDPDQELNHSVESVIEEAKESVLAKMYTLMDREDVDNIITKVHSLAIILNKELQAMLKGRKSFNITTERRGPISMRATLPSIARGKPQLKYYDLLHQQSPRSCEILIDISASTNATVVGPGNKMIKIRHSLLLVALSIAEVILISKGNVRLTLFSDDSNVFHCKMYGFSLVKRKKIIKELLDIPASGGTRLDEALSLLVKKGRIAQHGKNTIFIFLDGAPMEGYFRIDVDDAIQQKTINTLRKLEKNNEIFILWASSPISSPDYDQFFFNRCKRELTTTRVINVQSFTNFAKHAHDIWHAKPEKRKIPVIYNTNMVFPFELDDDAKKIIFHLKDRENTENTVSNISSWILDNFKYSLPINRQYRTANETFYAKNGCCGELSNLIVGMMRHLGIPSGIVEIDFVNQVRINHANVGYLLVDKPYMMDVTMGEINTTDAVGYPMSDARWARLMQYWRAHPRALKQE